MAYINTGHPPTVRTQATEDAITAVMEREKVTSSCHTAQE
jgi:hypothetical protein